jgi:hypothetical protein
MGGVWESVGEWGERERTLDQRKALIRETNIALGVANGDNKG